jgi:hypothetical protein
MTQECPSVPPPSPHQVEIIAHDAPERSFLPDSPRLVLSAMRICSGAHLSYHLWAQLNGTYAIVHQMNNDAFDYPEIICSGNRRLNCRSQM